MISGSNPSHTNIFFSFFCFQKFRIFYHLFLYSSTWIISQMVFNFFFISFLQSKGLQCTCLVPWIQQSARNMIRGLMNFFANEQKILERKFIKPWIMLGLNMNRFLCNRRQDIWPGFSWGLLPWFDDFFLDFLYDNFLFSGHIYFRFQQFQITKSLLIKWSAFKWRMLWIARTTRRRVRARPTVALMRTGSSRSTDRPTTISANVRIRQNIAKMCAL